eukprot:6575078-Pyramimonas_sp.AAC.1
MELLARNASMFVIRFQRVSIPGYNADVKGYDVDVKGYGMDVKGYDMDVKGYDVDVKGYDVGVKCFDTRLSPAQFQTARRHSCPFSKSSCIPVAIRSTLRPPPGSPFTL